MTKVAAALFEKRRDALIAAHDKDVAEHPPVDDMAKFVGEQNRQSFKAARLHASVTHGPDSATGDPVEILKQLDRRTVTKYDINGRFSHNYGGDEISVMFTWPSSTNSLSDNVGLKVSISSSDPGWANEAYAMLSEEIDKGKPSWHYFYNSKLRFTLGAVAALALTGSVFAAFYRIASKDARISILISTLMVSTFIAIIVIGNNNFYRRIFPPIELQGEDHHATAGRRIAFFGSIALSILIGILVNLIS